MSAVASLKLQCGIYGHINTVSTGDIYGPQTIFNLVYISRSIVFVFFKCFKKELKNWAGPHSTSLAMPVDCAGLTISQDHNMQREVRGVIKIGRGQVMWFKKSESQSIGKLNSNSEHE